jgi:hypothetical protein
MTVDFAGSETNAIANRIPQYLYLSISPTIDRSIPYTVEGGGTG